MAKSFSTLPVQTTFVASYSSDSSEDASSARDAFFGRFFFLGFPGERADNILNESTMSMEPMRWIESHWV